MPSIRNWSLRVLKSRERARLSPRDSWWLSSQEWLTSHHPSLTSSKILSSILLFLSSISISLLTTTLLLMRMMKFLPQASNGTVIQIQILLPPHKIFKATSCDIQKLWKSDLGGVCCGREMGGIVCCCCCVGRGDGR
jgi:hypothetical protein